jgi:N6-adenosine-specific RNA methylase IME4/ParB-like chromosome segregation protein Spo0J
MSIEGWQGQIHPAAELFPMMEGDEFNALVESIKSQGLRESVWLTKDKQLLDGRNRVRACHTAGVEPTFREYSGNDPVAFVMALNMERRHLTVGQRALVALRLVPMYEAEAAKRQGVRSDLMPGDFCADLHKSSEERRSTQRAGTAAKVSGRAVAQAKRVAENAPDLIPKIESGELALDKAEREVRRRVNAEEAQRLKQEPMPLPTGQYAVIELDPPWSYEEQNLGAPGNRNAEDKYATMTLQEIADLPIADLAAENCHLYLWTTANHLRHSWELLEGWGFQYRSILVWHKSRIGMGHYYRNQAEFVLFGVKGRLPLLAHDKPNVFAWEAPRVHSIKPDGFYELVEECSPSPRIRLFARAQREGWESWGNQA